MLVRSFRYTSGDTIQHKLYFGRNAPPTSLGIPGDMYIDTSPEAYRLFIRYESWREWPGVYRTPGRHHELQFTHPNDKAKMVWYSPKDVLWYKKNSFYVAKRACLLHYPDVFLVSAHELLRRTGLLDVPIRSHVSPSPSCVPPSLSCASPGSSLNTAPAPPASDIEFTSSLCVQEKPPENTVLSSTYNNPDSCSHGPFIPLLPAHDPSAIPDALQVSNLRSSADLQQPASALVISQHERTFEGASGRLSGMLSTTGLGIHQLTWADWEICSLM